MNDKVKNIAKVQKHDRNSICQQILGYYHSRNYKTKSTLGIRQKKL